MVRPPPFAVKEASQAFNATQLCMITCSLDGMKLLPPLPHCPQFNDYFTSYLPDFSIYNSIASTFSTR